MGGTGVKVAAFAGTDGPHVGVVVGDEIADVSVVDPALATDLASLLAGTGLDAVRRAVPSAPRHPLAAVALLAPVARPPKVLAIGLNYRDHVAETGRDAPEHQLWFNKQSTCVIGPGAPIEVPRESEQVDYEGELGIVIGRRCRHVPAARAREVVAGWTIVNDVSVRDWQYRTPTFTMGKSWDTHGPMGPWVVTTDELADPHVLRLRTTVNGDLRQDGFTGDMVFNCWEMIEYLSTAFTLEPGDVISTGTPAGVGMARRPPAWLRAGDTVRVDIEGIGALENPVIDAGDPAPLGLD
jgi:2-keto-4-pentenoate hydratase/2-oxohepta-3-ene-1,7-dioic acid hydratase in catechol pathway